MHKLVLILVLYLAPNQKKAHGSVEEGHRGRQTTRLYNHFQTCTQTIGFGYYPDFWLSHLMNTEGDFPGQTRSQQRENLCGVQVRGGARAEHAGGRTWRITESSLCRKCLLRLLFLVWLWCDLRMHPIKTRSYDLCAVITIHGGEGRSVEGSVHSAIQTKS